MKKYHKYVFDLEQRKFVGDFEEMYQAENSELFDSWQQEDMRFIERKITLSVLQQYQYEQVIDLGCGKGTFTHLLKTGNNRVFGLDISKTALSIATERYPDVDFINIDLRNLEMVQAFFESLPGANGSRLVLVAELLSYIENWPELVSLVSKYGDFFLYHLYLPQNPIGFVKQHADLSSEISKHCEIEEEVFLKKSSFQITFARK